MQLYQHFALCCEKQRQHERHAAPAVWPCLPQGLLHHGKVSGADASHNCLRKLLPRLAAQLGCRLRLQAD
jgi:hypothetical protein